MKKERPLKIGDYVRIKKTGSVGILTIGIGCPIREFYVDVCPGADGGYEYITMYIKEIDKAELLALNRYPVSELEKITKKEFLKCV